MPEIPSLTAQVGRKLTMTSLLAFYPSAYSSNQLGVGLLLMVLSLAFLVSARPYYHDALNDMQIVSYMLQCVILLYGLTIFVSASAADSFSADGARANTATSVALSVFCSMFFVLPPVYLFWQSGQVQRFLQKFVSHRSGWQDTASRGASSFFGSNGTARSRGLTSVQSGIQTSPVGNLDSRKMEMLEGGASPFSPILDIPYLLQSSPVEQSHISASGSSHDEREEGCTPLGRETSATRSSGSAGQPSREEAAVAAGACGVGVCDDVEVSVGVRDVEVSVEPGGVTAGVLAAAVEAEDPEHAATVPLAVNRSVSLSSVAENYYGGEMIA